MTKSAFSGSVYIEFSYDEDSIEFKDALSSYQTSMDHTATKDDMLRHVAFYITRFGIDSYIEGVGYVGHIGVTGNAIPEPNSGIVVEDGYDEFEFDEVSL